MYWRRRLLVLAGVILIVWAAVQLWPDDDSGQPASAPSGESSGTPNRTPSDKSSDNSSEDPTPSDADPTEGDVTVELTTDDEQCQAEDVRVSPSVPEDQTAADDVDVQLTVGNTGDEACTFEPDEAELLAVIESGDDTVWDSTACDHALLAENVSIPAGFARVVDVTWSGRRSGSDCSEDNDRVEPGKYKLKIATLGGEPAQTAFTLDPDTEDEDSDDGDDGEDDD